MQRADKSKTGGEVEINRDSDIFSCAARENQISDGVGSQQMPVAPDVLIENLQ